MNRITPAQVVAAYQSTGFTPMRGAWYDNESCRACPLTATFAAATGADDDSLAYYDTCEIIEDTVINGLRLNPSYVTGYARGWDGLDLTVSILTDIPDEEAAIIGYLDGRLAAIEAWQGED